jgi:hypothetical protein
MELFVQGTRHATLFSDPPEMQDDEAPSRLTSLAASTISLSCRANGQPQPNITWTKEGKRYSILSVFGLLI